MTVTLHSILIICEKPQSVNIVRNALPKNGLGNVTAAHSYQDAMKAMLNECPHLIIFESDLSDGPAIGLLKKVRAEPLFAKTPIIFIRKASKEELADLIANKVSAIISKPFEAKALEDKVTAVFNSLGYNSPYGIKGNELLAGETSTFKVSASVIGRDDNHLICQSALALGEGSKFMITPSDAALEPIFGVAVGSAQSTAEKSSNMFSLSSLLGKGRNWVMKLSPVSYATQQQRKIIVMDSDKNRLSEICKIMEFHKMEVEPADSVQKLCNVFSRAPDSFSAVFMTEALLGASAIPWDKAVSAAPEQNRPHQIVGTSSRNSISKGKVHYLVKPFGVEQIMETIEMAVAQKAQSNTPGVFDKNVKEIPVQYVVKGRLLSVDEAGGVIEVDIQPSANATLAIEHPNLEGMEKLQTARVVSFARSEQNPQRWNVRLSTLAAGSSKGLFWKPLQTALLSRLKPAEAAPAPTPAAAPAPAVGPSAAEGQKLAS